MPKEIVTDELIRQVRNAVIASTYILRHPTRYTTRNCDTLRTARKEAMDLLDQLVIDRADKEPADPARAEQILQDDIPF